jgi:tetratricopeptide (TPR) repeat protein
MAEAGEKPGGLDAELVRRWEVGQRWPGELYRQHLVLIFNMQADELGLLKADELALKPDSAPTGRYDASCADTSVVGSTALLATLEASNIGPRGVMDLYEVLRIAAGRYLRESTQPLMRSVVAVRDQVANLLQGTQPSAIRRDLLVVGGWSTVLLAWMATDLGRPDVSAIHVRAAWACAEQAGHSVLQAWVCKARESNAFWQGDLAAAAEHAGEGLRHASGAGGGTELMMTSSAALYLAQRGDVEQALTMLNRARDIAGRYGASDDDLGGPLSCPPERATGYWADTYLRLGQPDRALELSDAAVAASEADPAPNLGTVRMVRLHQTLAHVHLRNIDGASVALGPVLDTPDALRAEPLLRRLIDVDQALAQVPDAATRRLRRAIFEFRETTTARATMP